MSKTVNIIGKVGRVCKFDKVRDFQKVESGLVVDLTETLKTGIVKESNSILETNGIEDPESIVGMVRDRFDAIEADRAIRKYGKKADIKATPSAPTPKAE